MAVACAWQLFASLTERVYVPAHSCEAVGVVCPPVHEYEYGAVPLAVTAVADPSQVPWHDALMVVVDTENCGGFVMMTLALAEHALESVTTTVYVPAQRAEAVAEVAELVQEYVYGLTPPAGTTVADPLHAAKQSGFTELVLRVSAAGWVMVTEAEAEHPVLSRTMMV